MERAVLSIMHTHAYTYTLLKLFMNYIVNRPIDFSFLRDQEPPNQEARPLSSVCCSPSLPYPLSIHSQMLAREIYASSRHSCTQVRLQLVNRNLITIRNRLCRWIFRVTGNFLNGQTRNFKQLMHIHTHTGGTFDRFSGFCS